MSETELNGLPIAEDIRHEGFLEWLGPPIRTMPCEMIGDMVKTVNYARSHSLVTYFRVQEVGATERCVVADLYPTDAMPPNRSAANSTPSRMHRRRRRRWSTFVLITFAAASITGLVIAGRSAPAPHHHTIQGREPCTAANTPAATFDYLDYVRLARSGLRICRELRR